MTVYEKMRADRKYCVGMIGNMLLSFMQNLPAALRELKKGDFNALSQDEKERVMLGFCRSLDLFLDTEDVT